MDSAFDLLNKDPVMAMLIAKYGVLGLSGSTDYFGDLASSIIGQQLSNKAASTICGRVVALCGNDLSPDKILALPPEKLREAGLSQNKAAYIQNLAKAVRCDGLDLTKLKDLPDGEVIEKLTVIKGIGVWTAEMFLIFSLAREDIFSHGDGGLHSALIKLYANGSPMTKEQKIEITDRWKPFRSLASLYLWRSIDN